MATTIGKEDDLLESLENLIQLDHDAVEAYEAAIDRLDDGGFSSQMRTFRDDHLRHIEQLSPVLAARGRSVPSGGDLKRFLTKGKVVLADMAGDKGILEAMRSNEEDTTTAYGRAAERADLDAEVRPLLQAAAADEGRHKSWIETTLDRL